MFLSTFLDIRWMEPFAVSALGIDSRYPTLEVLDEGAVAVRYHDGEEGWVEQVVRFDHPDTITEDINPLDYVFNEGLAVPIRD